MTENLVVIAHPDDETLWFGATILARANEKWTVVCVTESKDPAVADRRRGEMESACAQLGVADLQRWRIPDEPLARLPMPRLREKLAELDWSRFDRVWTHGPSGEYGHFHHQDVGFAVHEAGIERGRRVSSVSYHCVPDEVVVPTADIYRRKLGILTSVYAGEFYSFVHLLPTGGAESFCSLGRAEADLVYAYYSGRLGLGEVRARWAAAGAGVPTHTWLEAGGGQPPCPSETYSLMATADEFLGRVSAAVWADRSAPAGAPELLGTVGEEAGIWQSIKRTVLGARPPPPTKTV